MAPRKGALFGGAVESGRATEYPQETESGCPPKRNVSQVSAQSGPAASRKAAARCRAQVFDRQSALWCLTPSIDDGTLHHK